jgi:hypothetical protein
MFSGLSDPLVTSTDLDAVSDQAQVPGVLPFSHRSVERGIKFNTKIFSLKI